jgi:hypothetical protein
MLMNAFEAETIPPFTADKAKIVRKDESIVKPFRLAETCIECCKEKAKTSVLKLKLFHLSLAIPRFLRSRMRK